VSTPVFDTPQLARSLPFGESRPNIPVVSLDSEYGFTKEFTRFWDSGRYNEQEKLRMNAEEILRRSKIVV
jgi:hypothetical protein